MDSILRTAKTEAVETEAVAAASTPEGGGGGGGFGAARKSTRSMKLMFNDDHRLAPQ
jgi:hypothetical protein